MSRWLGYSLVLAAALGFVVWLAHRAIYYPMRYPRGEWANAQTLGVADVELHSADGIRLHGWYRRGHTPVVTLFLHGNAGNVSHRDLHISTITAAGSSIFVPDYRGYGKSEGSPSERGLYADADAAYNWLLAQGWTAQQIVIHGESLGSAVAVELAARKPCAAVVLEAPFTSVRAVAGKVVPFIGPLLVSGFDSKSKIGRIHAPLLIFHGDRDEVIDYNLGRELFGAAPQPKLFVTIQGAGHNDIVPIAGDSYVRALRQLYTSLRG